MDAKLSENLGGGVSQNTSKLSSEEINYVNAIFEAGIDLEKAQLMLSELLNEYDWDCELNLRNGLMYACSRHKENEEPDRVGHLTWKFVYDYRKIMKFISIALDYVYEAIQHMENVEGGAA